MAAMAQENNRQSSRIEPTQVRRRSKLGFTTSEKKIADDEFMAAAIGDTEWLRQSLRNSRGAINYDKNGLTPMHLAAIHGRLDCLRLLVEKIKLDVNISSSTGWRPIHLVISNQTGKRSYNCLVFLLSKGADPSITNEDGISPMHQAASEGHVQCLKALIEVGANIDGEDCRGHKPIDLAKLWGHKKSARILAAEMWHRDKDFVAKEMRQLQKVKMQQVLREIEADEEHRADQQFYGDIAFNQWLESRDLQPKPTCPPSLKPLEEDYKVSKPKGQTKGQTKGQGDAAVKPKPEKSKDVDGHGLARANSQQRPSRLSLIEEEGMDKRPERSSARTVSMSVEDDKDRPRRRTPTVTITEPVREVELSHKPKETNTPGYSNVNPWVKSPKVPPSEYISRLPDHYPRDVYTMLPKYPAVRQGRSLAALDSILSGNTSKSVENQISPDTKLRMPKLPPDVIERELGEGSTKRDRRVVFKCENIVDTQRKKCYDPDTDGIMRSEIGMHMTSDVKCRLFQSGLQPERVPRTPSTVISGVSDVTSSTSSTNRSRPSVRVDVRPLGGAQVAIC